MDLSKKKKKKKVVLDDDDEDNEVAAVEGDKLMAEPLSPEPNSISPFAEDIDLENFGKKKKKKKKEALDLDDLGDALPDDNAVSKTDALLPTCFASDSTWLAQFSLISRLVSRV